MIHPLAYVDPQATIDSTANIDAYAVVMGNAVIGAHCHLHPHAVVYDHVAMGDHCEVFPGAVVGAIPQDLKFQGEETYTIIGDHCVLRECSTVHRGTASKGKTVIGSHNLIMAYSHIAHDCVLGNHIIMSNAVQLAGEVMVGDYAVLGGGSLVHQFTRIGAHVMLQGGSRVNKDLPPFATVGREPITYAGVNAIGMRRRNFTQDDVETAHAIYRIVYQSQQTLKEAIDNIEQTIAPSAVRDEILAFLRASERGIVR
ncbi:MAG: acyl-ACP--UDP-N-acetylglucosamine O-acyltransferase [Bacteroidales bacterium]|nr:acyl-ACP--UDP-N-acetylglucosamine O-acyltransferase [Bacteroidales bacterium]